MSRKYIEKRCFLCEEKEKISDLYPQSFTDSDLDPKVFSARRVTEHFHYRMVRCENCGLVFSRSILGEEDLYALYRESSFTFGEVTKSLRADYWRPLESHCNRLNRPSALEIGCSSGFFLEELQSRGFKRVAGCEPSLEAKASANESVRDSIHSSFFKGRISFPTENFDLVCSFHTLDHISDPRAFIEDCKKVLKPGGMVYFVTHDVQALQAKLLGEKSPIIDIEHIYLFNQQTLRKTLEVSGFKSVEVGRFKNSYPLGYWMKMVPLNSTLKRQALKVMDWTGLSHWSPSIPAGNIYAIAQAPD